MTEDLPNKKNRNWCFTINNYEKLSDLVLNDMRRELSAAKYWVIGKEVAPNTGTKHFQGFVSFNNPQWFSRVQKCLKDTGAHIEWCKGSAEQNITYCKKEGDWEEYGEPPMSQKRKGEEGKEAQQAKWRKIGVLAQAGKMDDLLEEYPRETISCYRTLKLMRFDQLSKGLKDLEGELENLWFVGEKGAGKSLKARRMFPNNYNKDMAGTGQQWWDNYNGEETVILDDVSPFNKSYTDQLKTWSDRYVFNAQVKGSYMKIRPKRIIVTSQYAMEDIWTDEKTLEALRRRFKVVEVKEWEEAKNWEWDERYEEEMQE